MKGCRIIISEFFSVFFCASLKCNRALKDEMKHSLMASKLSHTHKTSPHKHWLSLYKKTQFGFYSFRTKGSERFQPLFHSGVFPDTVRSEGQSGTSGSNCRCLIAMPRLRTECRGSLEVLLCGTGPALDKYLLMLAKPASIIQKDCSNS